MRLGVHLFLFSFMAVANIVPMAFAAPIIAPIDDETIVANETLRIPIYATGARHVRVLKLEPWMTFDGSIFTATPGDQDVGKYRITVVASDGRSRAFKRIVISVLSAPVSEQISIISISDAAVVEGDNGSNDLLFTVSLDTPANGYVNVNYTTADGSATTANNDYTPAEGVLTIDPGSTSTVIAIDVRGDTIPEGNETLTLTLSNPTANVSLGQAVATGSILNDDLTVIPATPNGVFSLTPANSPIARTIIEHPAVAGVVIRSHWPVVEATEGNYDWSYLDAEIERVSAAGKAVSIVVTSGGLQTPQWLLDSGIETFSYIDKNEFHSTFGQEVTIPLFWDPVFLEKKIKLIRAMGSRYTNHAGFVSISAHCANGATDDWNVPASTDDLATWESIGFSSSKLLTACQSIIDATMEAFPNQSVRTSIGSINRSLDTDTDFVARELVLYANSKYPGRLVVQKHNINVNTPDPLETSDIPETWKMVFDNYPNNAVQLVWSASDTGSCRLNGKVKPCDPETVLRTVVETAFHYNFAYIEVYGADVQNPELDTVLDYAASLFGG